MMDECDWPEFGYYVRCCSPQAPGLPAEGLMLTVIPLREEDGVVELFSATGTTASLTHFQNRQGCYSRALAQTIFLARKPINTGNPTVFTCRQYGRIERLKPRLLQIAQYFHFSL
jgi:hypothetical protein